MIGHADVDVANAEGGVKRRHVYISLYKAQGDGEGDGEGRIQRTRQ